MNNLSLNISLSPCPNDTFIFDALLHRKINTHGISYNPVIADVENLNRDALKGIPDISKISFGMYPYIADHYDLLTSGSALGDNCGPILIAAKKYPYSAVTEKLRIGIPGKYTTANLLLSVAFPLAIQKVEMEFSEIEDAILGQRIDAGVIIHENRFTYEKKGLLKILDLGEYWTNKYHSPIPLGGIIIRKELEKKIKEAVNDSIRKSVEYALSNPGSSLSFVREYAKAMDEYVMFQHINLYVNRFSVNLGKDGKKAISLLFEKTAERKITPPVKKVNFV